MKDETKSPCLDCKRWQDCPHGEGKNWYSYAEIRFCPFQVIWIHKNYEELYGDKWPQELSSSGYTDAAIHTGYNDEAYFVKPRLIIAEVEKRMETVSQDAREAFMDAIEKEYFVKNFSPPALRVLMYLKGKTRKRVTYALWKALKNSYKNISK